MAFPQLVKDQAWRRSGGKCECTRSAHTHPRRCNAVLSRASAEYHHIHAQAQGGHDGLSNCEVLCHSCHVKTPSYGH